MLQNYDPFKLMKYKAFNESETVIIAIAEFLVLQCNKTKLNNTQLKVLFMQMIKVCFINYFSL